ncbi:MAG: hypothetical protein HRT73_00245 [Flavobacteriales bacterium]|nr:hypothetical protein [Flavobacteriales bacterium]
MNKLLSILLLLLISNSIWSQYPKIDSLQNELTLIQEDSIQSKTLEQIGNEWLMLNQDTSYHYYEKALKIELSIGNLNRSQNMVRLLFDILYESGQSEEVILLCEKYIKYYKEKECQECYFSMEYLLASYYFILGEHEKALKMYSLMITKTDVNIPDERAAKASCYGKRSLCYSKKGEYFKAISDLDSALVLADSTNYSSLNSIYGSYGLLYLDLEERDLALLNLEKAAEVANKSDYSAYVVSSKHSLAQFYLHFKEYKDAEKFALSGLATVEKEQKDYFILIFCGLLTEIYISSNQISKAEKLAKRVIKISSQLNMEEQKAYAKQILGRIALVKNNFEQARLYCEDSWSYYKTGGFPKTGNETCKCLFKAYEGLKKPEKALTFYKQHILFKDSLFGKKEIQKALRSKYSFELKLQQAGFKNEQIKQDLIANQKLKTKNQLIIGVSILSILILALGLFIFKTRQQKRETEIAIQKEQVQAQFSQQLLQSQEDERVRISRELHDSVGQDLILLKSEAQLKNDTELETTIATTLNNVREITQGLHPFVLEQFGLTAALKKLVKTIDNSTDIFITEEIENIDNLLSKQQELGVYRIAQEAMNNIIKHANSPSALIAAKKDNQFITLSIKDYGKGFDWSEKSTAKNSLGMKTLQERAKILNANLNIDSEIEKGTTIYLKIPLKNA